MLKNVFTVLVTQSSNGLFQPPLEIGREVFDAYPTDAQIEAAIVKHDGDSASVNKTVRLQK
ncbi:hypothetical protein [Cohnella sp. JJ-181]|uniref:hypothetical protein n=1 Tax=Cohnella rhizoplanae TaxID=2974897 RepID=UPI0022FF81F7|nr:hypothetical protein [Cohnella sp. JJ-181]CAI6073494.1 hypothetical protein COHCIP112018_02388 [Cohnella sp. JJ-181]